MGAKDWMLFFAEDDDIPSILRSAPPLDRDESTALARKLFPTHTVEAIDDGSLSYADPPDDVVYAGCFPGLAIVCTSAAALDRPSGLEPRFLAEASGRTVYLHAMHSVVDWFAFAKWNGTGELVRALSVSPDSGFLEDVGPHLPFEEPYWSGRHPVEGDDYPLPFHPLELGEAALRALFGFNYEGEVLDDDFDPDQVVLAGFRVSRPGTDTSGDVGTPERPTTAPATRSRFGWLRRR